jgi:pectate lyase
VYEDGQIDIIRASDFVTVSWNYFHDHWKSSLVGNDATFRDLDFGHLHVTYHHNYWRNMGTRGPAGRFGHQHVYNNLYEDFLYQAIHSRSDNQVRSPTPGISYQKANTSRSSSRVTFSEATPARLSALMVWLFLRTPPTPVSVVTRNWMVLPTLVQVRIEPDAHRM